ncbi:hypothetical protein KPL76_08365 [Subtercola sp. PAMC28395]|uniref:hypothetical protein n=1 Tax=Subtercola sp. PAMC28395 TaxID=2846775 RepID=UPI001C0DECC0|nr:hypothetical protein [Subtercola sp. PAMC28395]QWT22815.1 hypothetical protein KPL76_08365 [Subtercola sp. PAMC28395]
MVVEFGTLPMLADGGVLVALSFVLWSTLDAVSTYLSIVTRLLVCALGVSLILVSGTIAAMDYVADPGTGFTSGMLQQLGASVDAAKSTPGPVRNVVCAPYRRHRHPAAAPRDSPPQPALRHIKLEVS